MIPIIRFYTMTRGSNSVDVIDTEKMGNIKPIELGPPIPRFQAVNNPYG